MAELIYKMECSPRDRKHIPSDSLAVRWLTAEEYQIFCDHLKLCGQKPISESVWGEINDEGTLYCGLFVDGSMVARAAVEKYSEDAWEVADVRTVKEFRCRGYAERVCLFVLDYIFANGRNATIRTEEDNMKKQRVIRKLGVTAAL